MKISFPILSRTPKRRRKPKRQNANTFRHKLKSFGLRDAFTHVQNYRLGLFLALCLILGGTSQDIVTFKWPLYVSALLLIGWVVSTPRTERIILRSSLLIWLVVTVVGLTVLYLIPLPPTLWQNLAGRDVVLRGYDAMGMTLPWLPLSMTPENTLHTLFDYLPPLAVILTVFISAERKEIRYGFIVILTVASLAAILGFVQVSGLWADAYLYDITNTGYPVGFMSNVNHQTTLLLIAISISIAFAFDKFSRKTRKRDESHRNLAIGFGACFFLTSSVLLAGSLFGYVMIIPVILASLWGVHLRLNSGRAKIFLGLGLIALIAIGVYVLNVQNVQGYLLNFNREAQFSRFMLTSLTFDAVKDFGLFGTGPGSFYDIYKLYEDRAIMTTTFAPHAHNDVVEFWLEFGVFGLIIMVTFLYWFGRALWKCLPLHTQRSQRQFVCLLGIGVIIAHCFVDYPLRTLSISSVFAFLCASQIYFKEEM